MVVPDSSPQASAGVPIRIPQILMLADGTFFPLVANVVPWGRVSGPAGLAPEALLEREGSCRGFFASPTSVRGVCFNWHRRCSSRLRSHTHDWYCLSLVHPRRCSRASSPRAWAHSRGSG
jgi:hypothetical protein